jgi:hypothetical protein
MLFNILMLLHSFCHIVPEPLMFTKLDIYICICHVYINRCPVSWIIAMSFYYKLQLVSDDTGKKNLAESQMN